MQHGDSDSECLELWSHNDVSSLAPKEGKELNQWEAKEAQIISWILSSIGAHMMNNLRPYSTTKKMWDYLQRIYHQDNTAKRFQLELEISNLSQGNPSIEQYYSGFINLCSEGSTYVKLLIHTIYIAFLKCFPFQTIEMENWSKMYRM